MNAKSLAGVLPVFQTPYREDETIDAATLEAEINWLYDCGADGIVMAMVSEILRLDGSERRELAELSCRFGSGRGAVGNSGVFTFTTVNPGPTKQVPGKPAAAPFISVAIFARGLTNRLFTRIYLPEDTEALANDPLLSSLDPERRKTLIARRDADGGLTWDVRLQGEGETVFLDFQ